MNRRFLLQAGALALAALPVRAAGGWFDDWLREFEVRMLAQGYSKGVVEAALTGLEPDPRVSALDAKQPEFARPVGDYIRGTVTEGRIAIGRAKRSAVPELSRIETTYGVPRDILIAVWAMESGFGQIQGDFDVIRSLATLAAMGRRRAWAEEQLEACLEILSKGRATRARLRGSWAGAMGQTQLIPSVFLTDAVDVQGLGRPDIWGSPADALASAANLLAKSGWKRGQGWAREVIVRPGFDWSVAEEAKEPAAWWTARGVRRADGLSWTGVEAFEALILICPAGARGPAFLLLPNHFVIRAYNNSVAYALAVGLLADRFGGASPLRAPWPSETALSLSERLDAQTALTRLGFYHGEADGLIGAGARAALRAWQKKNGLVADGYLTPELVRRLRQAAR